MTIGRQPQLDENTPASDVKIVVPAKLRQAAYANLVNMDVSQHEVTLDFIYVNRRDDPPGTLVARVALPIEMLEKLTDNFVQALEIKGRNSE